MKDRTRDEAKATISKMAGRQEEDLVAQLLPDDVLANILSRLAPRSLAVSRCVCPAWRALIDGRRLLRADLLPLSLGGIFLLVTSTWFPPLFSRPWTGPAPAICGDLDSFFGADEQRVLDIDFCDHCNGAACSCSRKP